MKYILVILILSCGCNDADNNNASIEIPLGGYDFPDSKDTINKENIYCYPILKRISRKDSFYEPYYQSYFFNAFKEQNLSLKPADRAIFRLVYQDSYAYVITLTSNEIIVKKGISGYGNTYPEIGIDNLTPIEQLHLSILKWGFPLDEKRPGSEIPAPPAPPPPPDHEEEELRKIKAKDSIIKNTPELFNPAYYAWLLKKAAIKIEKPYSFRTERIKITKEKSKTIVDLINASGYWQLAFDRGYCGDVMDGYGFYLEANNGVKYNLVRGNGPCNNDTSKFHKACQELIKLANLDKKIQLVWSW